MNMASPMAPSVLVVPGFDKFPQGNMSNISKNLQTPDMPNLIQKKSSIR
jgi:hypothetical protein